MLITLGIIGVVASMTIPSLVNKYKNIQTVTQLKKVYSEIQQVFNDASFDNGNPYEWDWNDGHAIADNLIIPRFKILDKYASNNYVYPMCNKTRSRVQYSWLDGVGVSTPFTDVMASFSISNGVCIGLEPRAKQIYVDVNGAKKESKRNIFGRDLFIFEITKEGRIMPWGYNLTKNTLWAECTTKGKGKYCAARIMMDDWEMNY